jgi:hypothetical protein
MRYLRFLAVAGVTALVLASPVLASPVLAFPGPASRAPAGLSPAAAWQRGAEVAMPANAAADPEGHLFAVGCWAPGSCEAGGYYAARAGDVPVTVSETKGKWARAEQLGQPSNAAASSDAEVSSIACPAAGSCAAVGAYSYGIGTDQQGFTATLAKGKWSAASTIKLPANSAKTVDDGLYTVTCTAPGSCEAAGYYTDTAGKTQLMAVAETKGRWQRAVQIASPPNAGPDPAEAIAALACPRPGYCAAVGSYADASFYFHGFVASETNGKWGRAAEVALPANAATDPYAELDGVACSSVGSCVAVGSYEDSSALGLVIAVSESKGKWGRAAPIALPSNTGTTPGDSGQLFGLSCSAAGSCAAVGGYATNADGTGAMAVTEAKGRWGQAVPISVPANGAAGSSEVAFLYSVACLTDGACTAVGLYDLGSGVREAMAVARP